MHRKKRTAAAVIFFAVLLNCFNVSAFEKTEIYAEIIFGENGKLTNATMNCGWTKVEKGGKQGAKTSKAGGAGSDLYAYVDVADKILYDIPNDTPIEIDVEYYDEGSGSFALDYDSYNPQEIAGVENNDIWHCSEIVRLENTKQWKTYTFHFEDMRFTNRGNGDFRVGIWDPFMGFSAEDVVFGSITVRKADYISLLKLQSLTTEKIGNINEMGELIRFTGNVVNKSDQTVDVTYKYTVTGMDGKLINEFTDEYKFVEYENKLIEFTIDNPGKYGIYTLGIEMTEKSEEKEYTSYTNTEFSVSKILEEDDKNPYYGACQQVVGQSRGDAYDTTKLMTMAGLSYVRDECPWEIIEKEKGKLAVPDDDMEKFKTMKSNGIDIIYICDYYNKFYDNGNTPASDEAIAGFANYCAFMAKALEGICDKFEIWNEYNLINFNKSFEPPETYAKMLKAAYTAIKNVNPNITVIGIDTAQIELDFTRRVFEAGGYDYLDVVSVHPYDWSGQFREGKLLEDMEALKNLMREFGEEKPVWITELGFSSYNNGYTQEEQAAKTILLNGLIRAYDLCDVFTQYCFYDRSNQNDQECCWGFVNQWGSSTTVPNGAKKSWLAVTTMNDLWGKHAETENVLRDDRFFAINFKNKKLDKNILLLVSGYGEKNTALNLGCGSVEFYDMYGNKISTVCSDNGNYSFIINEVPYYVVGDFKNFEYAGYGMIESDAVLREIVSGGTAEFELTSNADKDFNISVECDNGIELIENPGFIGNKASVKLTASDSCEIDDVKKAVITVSDSDGNVYYRQEHRIKIIEPIKVTITQEQAVDGSDTHWRARVVVQNNNNTESISGDVTVKEPDYVANMSKTRTFYELEPGEEITFVYNLPERVVKSTINLNVGVKLKNGFDGTYSKLLDFARAQYTDKKPKIDGIIDDGEWNGSWIGADEEKDICLITDWAGPDDLSFSGTMMWDEENFYLLAIVTDDNFSVNYTPKQPHYMYKGDNVQFAIDDKQEINIADIASFNEIGLAKVPDVGDCVWRYKSSIGLPTSTAIENAELAVKFYGSYTVYECSIPWSEIFGEGYEVDSSVPYRFSVLANDNDGNDRRGWIEYTSGVGMTKDIREFGTLWFVK